MALEYVFYGASLSVKHMDALSEPILQGKQAINQATLQEWFF